MSDNLIFYTIDKEKHKSGVQISITIRTHPDTVRSAENDHNHPFQSKSDAVKIVLSGDQQW